MRNQSRGFTLMEVMIAMVIVAILAAVAIPNYTQSVRKARRTEATTTLLSVSAAMENFLLRNNTYPATVAILVNGDTGSGLAAVGGHGLVATAGQYVSTGGNYRFTRATDDPTRGWRLQAIPYSARAQQETDCYFFNIYQNGEMRVQNSSNAFLSGAAEQSCLPT